MTFSGPNFRSFFAFLSIFFVFFASSLHCEAKKAPSRRFFGSSSKNRKAASSGVGFEKRVFGDIPTYIVTVNPMDKRVLVTSAFGAGYSDVNKRYPVMTMNQINRVYAPAAMVNGTFFDAKTKQTVCNVVVNGKLICEGDRGSTLFIDKGNRAGILLTSHLRGRNIDWSAYRWAIQSGPTLLYNGKMMINPYGEGFRDPGLQRVTRRSAVGITAAGKIVFISTAKGITFKRTAQIMAKLGAVHAINLDGGSSAGMGYGGNFPVKPLRKLPNFILIFDGKNRKRAPDYPSVTLLLKSKNRQIAWRYKMKADRFAGEGKYSQAMKFYTKACRLCPDNIFLYIAAARGLEASGRRRLSAVYYGRASLAALDKAETKLAKDLAKKSLKIDPENNFALETLNILKNYPEYIKIVLLIGEKKYKEAYRINVALLKKERVNPRFYTTMAMIFDALKRQDLKARAYYMSAQNFKNQKDRDYEAYLMAKYAVESAPHKVEYRKFLARAASKVGYLSAAKYHNYLISFLGRKFSNNYHKKNIHSNLEEKIVVKFAHRQTCRSRSVKNSR